MDEGKVSGFAHPNLVRIVPAVSSFHSSSIIDFPRGTAWLAVLCSLGFPEVVYAQGSVTLSLLVRAR